MIKKDGEKYIWTGTNVDIWPTKNPYEEIVNYVAEDIAATSLAATSLLSRTVNIKNPGRRIPEIKNVIFNDPATIVFWADGTKTVVQAQNGDVFDPEKGLAMAISKKALGNKGNYCNDIKKWTEQYKAKLKAESEFERALEDIKKAARSPRRLEFSLTIGTGKTKGGMS